MNSALSKQVKPQEEDPLITESRNSFLLEQDSILSQKLRLDALEQAFTSLMVEACNNFHPLMEEILKHEKFFRLKLSFLRDVCLEISYGWDNSFSLVPVKGETRGLNQGYFHFTSCTIQKDENGGFKPYFNEEFNISGKAEISPCNVKLVKYFMKKYTHKWMEKALRKELKRCIVNKMIESDDRVNAVT